MSETGVGLSNPSKGKWPMLWLPFERVFEIDLDREMLQIFEGCKNFARGPMRRPRVSGPLAKTGPIFFFVFASKKREYLGLLLL